MNRDSASITADDLAAAERGPIVLRAREFRPGSGVAREELVAMRITDQNIPVVVDWVRGIPGAPPVSAHGLAIAIRPDPSDPSDRWHYAGSWVTWRPADKVFGKLNDGEVIGRFQRGPVGGLGVNDRATLLARSSELMAIEFAIREVCPLSDNEGREDEDADRATPAYRCLGEDGDPIIESDTIADAIRGIHHCWHRTQERAEQAELALRRARVVPDIPNPATITPDMVTRIYRIEPPVNIGWNECRSVMERASNDPEFIAMVADRLIDTVAQTGLFGTQPPTKIVPIDRNAMWYDVDGSVGMMAEALRDVLLARVAPK